MKWTMTLGIGDTCSFLKTNIHVGDEGIMVYSDKKHIEKIGKAAGIGPGKTKGGGTPITKPRHKDDPNSKRLTGERKKERS